MKIITMVTNVNYLGRTGARKCEHLSQSTKEHCVPKHFMGVIKFEAMKVCLSLSVNSTLV
jgi:hypothetical protein